MTIIQERGDLVEFSLKYFLYDKKIIFIQILLTILFFYKIGFEMTFIYWIFLSYILLLLTFIDYMYKAVPDYLLLLAYLCGFFVSENVIEFLKNGFIFAGGFVMLNFFITYYIQNIKSRILKDDSLKTQTALGEGDIPIIALIGGILGIKLAFIALIIASMVAIIHGIYNTIRKENETPFIPYLVIGFLSVVFLQSSLDKIFKWIIV